MEPNHFGSAKIYAFPAGGREAEKIRREEASLAARGITTAPAGSGWYHDAAMHEDEATPRELPWWAEAESESRAKSVATRLF